MNEKDNILKVLLYTYIFEIWYQIEYVPMRCYSHVWEVFRFWCLFISSMDLVTHTLWNIHSSGVSNPCGAGILQMLVFVMHGTWTGELGSRATAGREIYREIYIRRHVKRSWFFPPPNVQTRQSPHENYSEAPVRKNEWGW